MFSVNVIIIVALINVTFSFADWKCTFVIIMQIIKKTDAEGEYGAM
jgi:hypothetical protein